MPANPVDIGPFKIGAGNALALIAGPCVIESTDHCLRVAGSVAALCRRLGLNYIFKASFDKANRTSINSFRGPGLVAGLKEEERRLSAEEEDLIFTPGKQQVLNAMLPRFVRYSVFNAVRESYTSENAARMMAMDNATKNAGEMIDNLTLAYNKARQQAITLELLDIVGGSEALKG